MDKKTKKNRLDDNALISNIFNFMLLPYFLKYIFGQFFWNFFYCRFINFSNKKSSKKVPKILMNNYTNHYRFIYHFYVNNNKTLLKKSIKSINKVRKII
jgi:hypothetical protein